MNARGIRLGRLFGINVTIDPSWIFIFLLTTFGLTSYFVELHRQWSVPKAATVALIGALLFFASILAHEFGHALVARTFNLPVREIRLFLFGGVSNIENEPPTPRAEFLIAIVGPLVSFTLGASMLMIASVVLYSGSLARFDLQEALRRLGPVMTILLWLGPLNLTIGLFNLIPGFPLDGGRVLRALLWKTTGDLQRATRWATLVGQAVGWAFISIGAFMVFGAKLPFFGQGTGSGLWLAFIGWFLRGAARSSYQSLLVRDALAGVRVADIMRGVVSALPSGLSVADAVRIWARAAPAEHTLPIVQDGQIQRLVGLISKQDLRRAPRFEWSTTPLGAIMTPRDRLVVALPNDDALGALKTLANANVHQLPVLDEEERLVGLFDERTASSWIEMNVAVQENARGFKMKGEPGCA